MRVLEVSLEERIENEEIEAIPTLYVELVVTQESVAQQTQAEWHGDIVVIVVLEICEDEEKLERGRTCPVPVRFLGKLSGEDVTHDEVMGGEKRLHRKGDGIIGTTVSAFRTSARASGSTMSQEELDQVNAFKVREEKPPLDESPGRDYFDYGKGREGY